ncbi:MAG: poly(A) polymerase [Cyclobacteriaceae bacterium]|jgi:poly(A) polymerase
MTENFSDLISRHPILSSVSEVSKQLDLRSFVIGGFVRDFLLYGASKKDIDILVLGSGITLAKALKENLSQESHLTVYKNFGTAALKVGEEDVEFVGARKESYRSDSRKPIVENGTLEDDQNRRDFTINALAISLSADTYGQLIDPFDGQSDLVERLIRTPLAPEKTFSDDPLRMMRAIRFASQLTFDIEAETFEGIKAMKDRIGIVSTERISTELNKIILSDVPSYGFKLLFASGLLEIIFPEMQALHGVKKKNGKSHKDNFYHTLQVLDNTAEKTNDLWLRWSAILHDIAKPATQRFHPVAGWTFHGHEDLGAKWVPQIFKKLKLPLNEKMKYVQKLVRLHLRPIALVKEEVTDSAIRRLLFEAGDDVDDLMLLCKADITSKNDSKVRKYLANFKKVEEKLKEVEAKDQLRNFRLPVTGQDLMAVFGLKPGPVIGEIKDEIREAILEGQIENSREPALELMRKIATKKGLNAVIH